jgi:hypothetical protein
LLRDNQLFSSMNLRIRAASTLARPGKCGGWPRRPKASSAQESEK